MGALFLRDHGFRALKPSQNSRRIIQLSVIASLVLIATAIWFWGANEVRGNATAVFCLTLIGGVYLMLANKIFPWLGLDIRDDAVERRNPAATIALAGALLSVAVIYAAGNLGEGPSYLENFFSAALGIGGLLVAWLVLECGAHVSVSIAEERDLASGIRFGGFLLAAGFICARAVAGDWHSTTATVHDFFHDGWPAAALCFPAVLSEWWLRPNRLRPFPSWPTHGLLPALVYLAVAGAWLWHLGKWEGMPL